MKRMVMNRVWTSTSWLSGIVLLISCGVAFSQAQKPPPARIRLSVPASLRVQLRKVGDRFVKPGKERLVLAGTIADRDGTRSAATLTYEIPRKFRFDRAGAKATC